jgi:hypothetical protein
MESVKNPVNTPDHISKAGAYRKTEKGSADFIALMEDTKRLQSGVSDTGREMKTSHASKKHLDQDASGKNDVNQADECTEGTELHKDRLKKQSEQELTLFGQLMQSSQTDKISNIKLPDAGSQETEEKLSDTLAGITSETAELSFANAFSSKSPSPESVISADDDIEKDSKLAGGWMSEAMKEIEDLLEPQSSEHEIRPAGRSRVVLGVHRHSFVAEAETGPGISLRDMQEIERGNIDEPSLQSQNLIENLHELTSGSKKVDLRKDNLDSTKSSKKTEALADHQSISGIQAPLSKDVSAEIDMGTVSEVHTMHTSEGSLGSDLTNFLADRLPTENGKIILRLEPQGLGKITVEISIHGKESEVKLIPSSDKTLEILSRHAETMGSILTQKTGQDTEVVVTGTEQSSTRQDLNKRDQGSSEGSQQQEARQQSRQRTAHREAAAETFLQQMRLGLI